MVKLKRSGKLIIRYGLAMILYKNSLKNGWDKMSKSGIYCITNRINNKKYIGQALNLKRRKTQHFNHYNSNIHLQHAMKKYGNENFEWEVLEYCSANDLSEREQFYIDSYDFANLYNLCPFVDSQQGLCKVPVLQIDIKTGQIIKLWDSLSQAAAAMNVNDSSISSVCSQNPVFDKKANKYHKRKSSAGYYWKYANDTSEIIVPNINERYENSKKPVAQIDAETGQVLKIYNGISDAHYATGACSSKIVKNCKGIRNSTSGYRWKYIDDLSNEEIASCLNLDINQLQNKTETRKPKNKIYGINLKTKESMYFETINEAVQELKVSYTHICSVANGKRKNAGGYEWFYAFT